MLLKQNEEKNSDISTVSALPIMILEFVCFFFIESDIRIQFSMLFCPEKIVLAMQCSQTVSLLCTE